MFHSVGNDHIDSSQQAFEEPTTNPAPCRFTAVTISSGLHTHLLSFCFQRLSCVS